jgi:hypothetical protein
MDYCCGKFMLYFTMVTFISMLQQLSKVNIVVNAGVFKRAIVIFWGMAHV